MTFNLRPSTSGLRPSPESARAEGGEACDDGDEFRPGTDVPKGTKLVYKIPGLADIDDKKLSTDEKDLKRYMQVILPAGESPKQYVDIVRSWDSVEDAQVAPEISLPGRGF